MRFVEKPKSNSHGIKLESYNTTTQGSKASAPRTWLDEDVLKLPLPNQATNETEISTGRRETDQERVERLLPPPGILVSRNVNVERSRISLEALPGQAL